VGTYTDSWDTYVGCDLSGKPFQRKPPERMLYRLEELDELFLERGWPGDHWTAESDEVFYVEAQIWSDGPFSASVGPLNRQ